MRRLIHINVIRLRFAHSRGMQKLPPFRERTAAHFRVQADEYRESARQQASPEEEERLIRLAERYEALAQMREEAELPTN